MKGITKERIFNMFCEQCGTKIEGEDKFCPNCGAPVQTTDTIEEDVFMPQNSMDDMAKILGETAQKAGAAAQKAGVVAQKGLKSGTKYAAENIIPKITKKMIIAAAAVLVVFVVVIAAIQSHKYTINVEDYVNVTFEGYDGYGRAIIDYDMEDLQLEVYKNAKFKGISSKARKKIKKMVSLDSLWSIMDDNVGKSVGNIVELTQFVSVMESSQPYCQLENDTELKNGDEVVVNIVYDNEDFADYGIKFTGTQKKFKVADLTEATVYDYFSNLDVTFSGIAPNVSVEVDSDDNGGVSDYVGYSWSKQDGIEKGEAVTLTLDIDEDGLMREYGYVIPEKTKEFKCDAVSEYVHELSQIPDEMMQKMRKQAEDAFDAYVASDWVDDAVLKKKTFLGSYLLKPKDGMSADAENYIYLVYKIDAKNPDAGKFSYYYYTCFWDAMILEDGTCSVDLSNYSTPIGGWYSGETFEKGNLTYAGYETLDSLFSNCVTKNVEKYEYESTVTE